jgi:PhnB protein
MTGTDNVSSKVATLELAPYIFFYGRSEEALDFYKKVLGGTYELQRNTEAPPEMTEQISADWRNKVMHASFRAPGVAFYASDGRESRKIDPEEGNISLAINVTDAAEGQRVFDALSQGGKVTMPLQDAFWGGKFGILHDRFGIEWMMTTP